jgi:predicted house-cleaning noncanonical NTP pyrophosphatase (MazG superfamily)
MTKLPKLVRDNIPAAIRNEGRVPTTRALSSEEYAVELERKLQEEVEEYLSDKTIEELADILEVVYAIAEQNGVSVAELEEVRRAKAVKNGAFKKRIMLEEIS